MTWTGWGLLEATALFGFPGTVPLEAGWVVDVVLASFEHHAGRTIIGTNAKDFLEVADGFLEVAAAIKLETVLVPIDSFMKWTGDGCGTEEFINGHGFLVIMEPDFVDLSNDELA